MVSHAVWKTWPSGLSNDKNLGLRPRFLSIESLGPCFSHGTGDHDQILHHTMSMWYFSVPWLKTHTDTQTHRHWYISAAEQEMQSVHFDSEADCRHTFFSSWVRICLTSGFNLSNVEFLNVLSTWLNYCYHYRYYYHNHYHNLTFPTMYSNHRPSAIRSSAHITTKMMNRKITSKPKRKK